MKIPKKVQMFDTIRITWLDSFTPTQNWHNEDDIKDFGKDTMLMTSIGFYLHSTAKILTISHTKHEESEQAMGLLNIPIGCITKIQVVK